MNLLEIRDKLDVIDREIVELYQKRMELCGEVARDKIRTGKKVFDPVREAQKLDSVSAMVKTDFDKQAVRELYQQLMTLSRRLQFEILTGHAAIISLLTKGDVIYTDADGRHSIGVAGGFVEVKKNQVSLCVELKEEQSE